MFTSSVSYYPLHLSIRILTTKFRPINKILRKSLKIHLSALAWSKLYKSVDMWLSWASQTWLSNWNLRHFINQAFPDIVIHSTSYLFLWVVCPINTITRAVPRMPMSRLLMSIDFMRDPLVEIYYATYLCNKQNLRSTGYSNLFTY